MFWLDGLATARVLHFQFLGFHVPNADVGNCAGYRHRCLQRQVRAAGDVRCKPVRFEDMIQYATSLYVGPGTRFRCTVLVIEGLECIARLLKPRIMTRADL